jgi:TPP-dependent pyruvate/acetoin dehydrogenase alpha subunit
MRAIVPFKRRSGRIQKIDPITQVLDVIMDKKYATEEEIEVIEQRVKDLVQECVDFAEESDYPPVPTITMLYTNKRTIHSSS